MARSLYLDYWLYWFAGQLDGGRVVQFRMQNEYGVETRLDVLPYSVARWMAAGWDTLKKVGRPFNTVTVKDSWGRPVLL